MKFIAPAANNSHLHGAYPPAELGKCVSGFNAMTTTAEEFFNFLFTHIEVRITGPKSEGHI